MKLSICIATHNEEEFIHYPLDSVYDIADEIIIVDGKSEDRTVEIARKYGDKVHIFTEENPPMFHINKQKAIEYAKGEWILQLDADEALSPELKKEVMDVLRQVPIGSRMHDEVGTQDSTPKFAGYWMPRKNYFLGRFLTKGGIYPDYTIRLYKNGSARFPCKHVHENVEINGEVGYLKQDLLHYADPDFSRYLKRWDRYTTLDVEMLKKDNITPSFFDYMIWRPLSTFVSIYLRHRGYMDGFQGYVWALFSATRNWVIYIKWRTS